MSEFNSYYGFLDKSPQGLRLSTPHWCYHLQCTRKGLLAESMGRLLHGCVEADGWGIPRGWFMESRLAGEA